MIIRILVIFLITFTPINATPCKDNPTCECSLNDSDELNIVCDIYNSTGFTINIKSRNNTQIICKNLKRWDQFYFKSKNISEKILESLSFQHCGLSNAISLKNVVRQIEVMDTSILIFQSFKKLYTTLKREHLQGFPSVKKLILSNNGLTNISNDLFLDFPELEYIDLSDNDIELPADIFKANLNLKHIILQQSRIEVIHNGTFNKLENVEYLNLMSNHLVEINPRTFDPLFFLRMLDLKNNHLKALSHTIFHGLKKLQHLDISMNYFSSIPSNLFKYNKELQKLLLHNNFNNISTLPQFLLGNMTNLTEVQLNDNGLLFLPENLFWGSSSLKDIFLNNNYLDTLPMNFFRGLKNVKQLFLQNNKIKILPDKIFADMEELSLLDLSNNRIVRLSSGQFHGLVSLLELNMERNQIKLIDRRSLYPLINLNIAKFSHNPLNLPNESQRLSVFYTNQYLKRLYLSNCSLFTFFNDWTIGNSYLRLLDLSHNFISDVTETIFTLPSHEITIDLSYNRIRNIHLDQIEEIVSWQKETHNVEIILEHNPLLCDCSLYDLLRYNERKMSTPVYNYSTIRMEDLKCVQPDGTNEIEISNLNSSTYECFEHEYFQTEELCQKNCVCKVRQSDLTRIIDCSYGNMYEFSINQARIFNHTSFPFILNLTGNFLSEIPSKELLFPLKVTGLLLSHNIITTITLDKLPNTLKVLELHNNDITHIYSNVSMYLNSLNLEKFTLSGNPIICDCDNQDLLNFIQSHQAYYEDINNLTCKNTHLPINQTVINALCPSDIVYIVIISVSLIIIVTVAIFLFYYRNIIRSWLSSDRTLYSVVFTRRNNAE